MTDYYTRVIVHGVISAKDGTEALRTLCDRIRAGLGRDPDDNEPGRDGNVAIAAGVAQQEGEHVEIIQVNKDYLRRIATGRGLNDPLLPFEQN